MDRENGYSPRDERRASIKSVPFSPLFFLFDFIIPTYSDPGDFPRQQESSRCVATRPFITQLYSLGAGGKVSEFSEAPRKKSGM